MQTMICSIDSMVSWNNEQERFIRWSSNGKFIVVGDEEGGVKIWSTKQIQAATTVNLNPGM